MTDLIAARLDFGAFLAGTTKPLIADGKLKALAIVARQALRAGAGHPDDHRAGPARHECAGMHFMMFAPAATPKPVIALLGAELHKVISEPSLQAALRADRLRGDADDGGRGRGRDAPDRRALAPLIKRLNIKLD